MAHKNNGKILSKRPSNPPPSIRKQQAKAIGRLMNAYREAIRNVTISAEHGKKAILLAEKMRNLFEPSDYGPVLVKEGLAAYALGIVGLSPIEQKEILELAEKKIRSVLKDPGVMNALAYSRFGENKSHRIIETISGCTLRAKMLLDSFELLHEMDILVVDGGEKNVEQLYSEPLEGKEYPVPVLVAHCFYAELYGMPGDLSPEEQLEKGRALEIFHYSMAETLGMPTSTIAAIGKVYTETRLELGDGEEIDKERILYGQCKEFRADIFPFAEKARKILGGNGLGKLLKKASTRIEWEIRPESQTVDPTEYSRIKSAARMLSKIREKNDAGRKKFGVANIQDILGITVVMDGKDKQAEEANVQDAFLVANVLVREVKKRFGAKVKDFEIKTEKRPSGYDAPHLKFKMTVSIGGAKRDVPVEIQVRPRKLQDECTKGRLSRGKKGGKIITDALVATLARRIDVLAQNFEATITRNSRIPEPRNREEIIQIDVIDKSGIGRNILPKQAIVTVPGECVAGVISMIDSDEDGDLIAIGFGEQANAYDEKGNKLGLFEKAPNEMRIELVGFGRGINLATCALLVDKVVSGEARGLLQEHMKYLKSMRKNNRK